MIRNTLIAIYILLVLAISAVSRAESAAAPKFVYEPKHLVIRPVVPVSPVDPLPGSIRAGLNPMNMLVFGNIEIRK
jgi:hypothetical protein